MWVFFTHVLSRPGMTYAFDWELKDNYLSNYPPMYGLRLQPFVYRYFGSSDGHCVHNNVRFEMIKK